MLLSRTFQVAEVPKAVLFKKRSLVYLSGGKVVEHLLVVLGCWLCLLDCGEGEKEILLTETKSGQQPTLLPVHSFFKSGCFFYQAPRAICFPPDLYVFELGSAKARHLFLEYFHFSYPVKILPIKGFLLEPFQHSGLRRCGVLGIPTNSVGS